MIELNISNENGVYNLHFRSDEKDTVMKVYSSLAKHFNKITKGTTQSIPVEHKVEPKIDPNKALQSTVEIAKQNEEQDKEKAEKRKAFYAKVLYYISRESNFFYSLLATGYPVGSEGGTLIVNLPNEAYNIISEDKRVNDIVASAIRQVSNNSSVSIQFQPEGDMSMADKLKNRLVAVRVE